VGGGEPVLVVSNDRIPPCHTPEPDAVNIYPVSSHPQLPGGSKFGGHIPGIDAAKDQ